MTRLLSGLVCSMVIHLYFNICFASLLKILPQAVPPKAYIYLGRYIKGYL